MSRDYWKKWKEALDSTKIPMELNKEKSALVLDRDGLIRESVARIEMLKKRLPDIELPTLKTPEIKEEPTEKLTLRERYGFKKTNYS